MEISAARTMLGPSVYADVPAVFHRLSGIEDWAEIAGDNGALAALFESPPSVGPSSTQCDISDCFTRVGGLRPEDVPHVFEHVCIELQNQAGAQLECVRRRSEHFDRAVGAGGVVIPYEESDVCEAAVNLAANLFNDLTRPSGSDAPAFEFAERRDEFLRYAATRMLPVQDRFLIRTARALDIPEVRLIGRIIQLGHGCHQQRLSATKTSHTNIVSNDLAANKDYARRLLDDLGLPVPRAVRVYRKRDVAGAVERVGGYPVVVKPNNGSMGGGVSVGMKNREEALLAYDRARKIARSVLVEEVVPGSDFRMLVINGKLCAASERVPGHVVGDGEQTIEALVDEVNRDPRRGDGPTQSWTRIKLDDQADRLLAELGYDQQSVPPAGEVVFLRRNANTSDGGTSVDVTDVVHPDNRAIAVRAAKAIGLDIAGVDILTTDITKSMWKTGGKLCEINSRPGLRKHIWPHTGKRRDVMTPILDMLFPAGGQARIPIVAVIGTGDTRTCARMLESVLSKAGHHVGLLLNRRVYSGGHASDRRKLKPAEAMRMIFLDPEVDVAVFELSPKDVLRHGIGCDAIDVTAVINDTTNDGSEHDANLADAIEVVTRATRKAVYVDASQPLASDAISGASVLWPIESGRNSIDPVSQSVAVDANTISMCRGAQIETRIPIAETLRDEGDETSARLRTGGVFASLCAHGLGLDPKDVYRNLSGYSESKKRSRRRSAKVAS